MTKQST